MEFLMAVAVLSNRRSCISFFVRLFINSWEQNKIMELLKAVAALSSRLCCT